MKLEVTGENLLPAIAYGDACGLPFEAQPAITEGSVTKMPSIVHNTFLDIPEHLQGTRGVWSDDTHLSLASTLSLLMQDKFDLDDQALAHVSALSHVTGDDFNLDLVPPIVTTGRNNGFGRATTRSIKRLAEGTNPRQSGEKGGSGNGVLMKIAPLVYFQFCRGTSSRVARQEVIDFTRMTHDTPEAVVSSLVHQRTLWKLMLQDPDAGARDTSRFDLLLNISTRAAKSFESKFDPNGNTSNVLKRLAKKEIGDRSLILNAVEGSKNGGGFYAPETLLMAYGSFMVESTFPDCVYRAVELGGDSDSIGSIVAGMAACYWGELDFPPDVEEIFAIERLRRISKSLAKAAVRKEYIYGDA